MIRRVLALALVAFVTASCVATEGTGRISGDLDVTDCWSGGFNLEPNFFGAETYRDAMTLRLQRDSDFFPFADGVSVLIDDFHTVRGDDGATAQLGQTLSVGLPPEVTPPGTPVVADAAPPTVHLNLYLQKTCRTQNVALYAAKDVEIAADGSCTAVAQDCSVTDPAALAAAPLAHSTVSFGSLFNGDILEGDEDKRRIEGHFDVYLTDPREACPGGGRPPPCRGHLTGDFDYLYQRSRPYQPFP